MRKSWVATLAAAGLAGAIAPPAHAEVNRHSYTVGADEQLNYAAANADLIPVTSHDMTGSGDGSVLTITGVYTPASVSVSTIIGTIPWWQLGGILLQPTWKCKKSDGSNCTTSDMQNSWYRQILILPTGFQEADRSTFWSEFDKVYAQMANAGSTWTTQKRGQILYIGYFLPGGALNTPTAIFGGEVADHPIRGHALSLSNGGVYQKVDEIRASIPYLRPMGVGVLFNTFQTGITANAAPPSFTGRAYGVAKFTRQDLFGAYVPTHELAHASLNFLDEYIEPGLETMSIRSLDVLTPLALFDGSWGGFINAISDLFSVYDYNISEMLAENGNVNISLSPTASRVWTPGYAMQSFAYEGGMFFGKGTYHMAGKNLMGSNHGVTHSDDGFDYAHSWSQQQVIDNAFGSASPRPNDRIRNAGPKNGWPLSLGSTTHVMMYDGDKLNHFSPTQYYVVQVGWYDRQWHTCWAAFVPYPCYNDVWTTADKVVYPSDRFIDLKASSLYGLVGLAQDVACGIGITEVPKPDGTPFMLCKQDLNTVATAFLPTFVFHLPYQDTSVPASQWFTTYWWRFRTGNGQMESGMTGWSSFYRSF